MRLFGFIRENDKNAYATLSDAQLRGHLAFCMAANQMRVRVDQNGFPTAVATYGFEHQKAAIFLFGIIGDRDFINYMRQCWAAFFPYYRVMYYRRGQERTFSGKRNFSNN